MKPWISSQSGSQPLPKDGRPKETRMNVIVRNLSLFMFVWLLLTGICLGKQVYLKDGGIIESQSAWRQGDKVFVKVNRDILAEFYQSEIDLRRTFPKTGTATHHKHRKTPATKSAAVSPENAKPATAPD